LADRVTRKQEIPAPSVDDDLHSLQLGDSAFDQRWFVRVQDRRRSSLIPEDLSSLACLHADDDGVHAVVQRHVT